MARMRISEDNQFADSTMNANPWEEELQQREESEKVEKEEKERERREEEQEEQIQRDPLIPPPKRTIPSTHNQHKPQPRKGITLIFGSVDQQIDLLEKQLNNVQAEFLRVQDLVADVRSTVTNLNKPEAIKLVEADASANYQRIRDRLKAIANDIHMIVPGHEGSMNDTPKNFTHGSDLDDARSESTHSIPLALPAPSPPVNYVNDTSHRANLASSASASASLPEEDSELTINPEDDVYMPDEFVVLSRSQRHVPHRQRRRRHSPATFDQGQANEQLPSRHQYRRIFRTQRARASRQYDRGHYDNGTGPTDQHSLPNNASKSSESDGNTARRFDYYEPRISSDFEDEFPHDSPYDDREEVHRPVRRPQQWAHPPSDSEDIDLGAQVKSMMRARARYRLPPNPHSYGQSLYEVPASEEDLPYPSRFHGREEVYRSGRRPQQWEYPYTEDIDHRFNTKQRLRARHRWPPNPPSSSLSPVGVPASVRSLSNQHPSSLSEARALRSYEDSTQEERHKDFESPRAVVVEPKDDETPSMEAILQEKQILLLEMLDEVQIRLEVMQNRQTSKSKRDEKKPDGDKLKGKLWDKLKSKVVEHRKKQEESGGAK